MTNKLLKNLKKIWKFFLYHVKAFTFFFSFLIIIGLGLFLYFNFYKTIISAKEIIILQTDISPAKINIQQLEKVEKNYQEKIDPQRDYEWQIYNGFFQSSFVPSENEEIGNEITPVSSF